VRRPRLHDLVFTADQVAAVLDPSEWASIRAETVPRSATDPDGNPVTVHDAVLHAVRRR
jgi:hypothetical protein